MRSARVDDPSLVSAAGLVPVLPLAQRASLGEPAGQHLTVPGGAGCAGGAKVSALVAGMGAGGDSIDDIDLLRHGAMGRLVAGVRAGVDVGHVPAIEAAAAEPLTWERDVRQGRG